jgi:hypothetical protein
MKIIISENNKKYTIPLPLFFLRFLPIFNEENLSKQTLKSMIRCIKTYKKEFGAFTLVEVQEANEQTVKIII